MTIWQEIGVSGSAIGDISRWIERQMHRELPPAYALLPVADQVDRAAAALRHYEPEGYVGTESSGIRIVTTKHDDDYLVHAGLSIAHDLDPDREWFRWEDLSEEERPESFVADELVSSVDGLASLGPGGKLTVSRFHDGTAVMDVVVRPKEDVLLSRWRSPSQVASGVSTMIASSPRDIRLRAGLGYEEASSLEAQTVLRPMFIFLLDRPMAASGPRWRVALATPATSIDGDDSGDGMTTGSGDYEWCV